MEGYKSLGGETFEEPELIEDALRAYVRVDESGNPSPEGKYMLFGSYPQSKVTDAGLIKVLGELAGELPTRKKSKKWTSYKYYIENRDDTDYMWYRDIEHEGVRYRGVYFILFRPSMTSDKCSMYESCQYENGYHTTTAYWFKYEPLRWEILQEQDGKAWLLADVCIDSQAYRNVIIDNNYGASSIRGWLNGTLLNIAFDETQRTQISYDNIDYIHLLSMEEAKNINITTRRRGATDYAKCQGVEIDNFCENCCSWWLRSLGTNHSNAAYIYSGGNIHDSGTNVNNVVTAVRPALWIKL